MRVLRTTKHLRRFSWCLSFIFCLTLHLGCTQNTAKNSGNNDSDNSGDLFSQNSSFSDVQSQIDIFNIPQAAALPASIPQQAPPALTQGAQDCFYNPLANGCVNRQQYESEEEIKLKIEQEYLSSLMSMRQCAKEVFDVALAPEGSTALAQQQVDIRKKLVNYGQQIYQHNMQAIQ